MPKAKFFGETANDKVKLKDVPFGAFAKDVSGRPLFALYGRWYWADPVGEVVAVNSTDIYVTQMPEGTQIILTSTK